MRTVQADSVSDADSESRHKECPLFISAGAYSAGRLRRVVAGSLSQKVCRNDFLIPIGADFRNLNLPALYAYPKGSNPTTGLTLLWARNPFRVNFNHCQVSRKEAGKR